MNKIVRFNEFSKNEELFHGYGSSKGEGGGIGSETANKIFGKVGSFANKFFGGLEGDVMGGILDELIQKEKEEDRDFIKSQVDKNITAGKLKGKSEDEIRTIVADEIINVKEINAHLLNK
jgi:hypothetical protein